MKVWQQDWAEKWALYSPDKIAVKEYETGKVLSYAQLNQAAIKTGNYLSKQYGIHPGARIAVVADFCLEYIVLFTAAQKFGFVLVPLNYRLAVPEVRHILEDCSPDLFITEFKYSHYLSGLETPKTIDLGEIQNIIESDAPSTLIPTFEADENDCVFILYTSGTTGNPKGVKYTHKMLFWNSINTAMSLMLNTESRTVNVMPPFHTGGWNVLLTPFLHHGAYTCICKKFDAAITLQLLVEEKATIYMGVPTMLQMMAQQPQFAKADFSSLYYIIVGGEAMPIPLIEQYHAKGVAIRQGYGMTEVGPNLTSLHHHDAIRKIGSIGRPNFYVRTRIVNEKGQECAVNEPGELWLNGPMTTPGYWNNEQVTKESFSEDGTWFKTGDMVRQDEEHYLYVVDRIKNMYISGGENVYPAEIEKVLIRLEGVKECTVIGVSDAKWGETGKAYIVLQENAPLYSQEALKDYCKSHLAKFKVPSYFEFLNELPKNDAGKIDKKELRKMHEMRASG